MLYFSAMYNKTQPKINQTPILIVQYYLENGSLRKTAKQYGIHYQTLFKWLKLYRKNKIERLKSWYNRPWNRADSKLEKHVVLLKEKDPTITLKQARNLLARNDIKISIKGIWGIWRRYGFAGKTKFYLSEEKTQLLWTAEARKKFKHAQLLFKQGKIKKSADLLNEIPLIPKNELLPLIPDRYLNLNRKIEKTTKLFGKVKLSTYLKKTRKLYKQSIEKGLLFSALRIGITEVTAISWTENPRELLTRTEELQSLIRKRKKHCSHCLWSTKLTLLISKGIAYAGLANFPKAKEIAQASTVIARKVRNPHYYDLSNLGALYTQLEEYRKAEYWFQKASKKASGREKSEISSRLSNIFFMQGKYAEARKCLRHGNLNSWIDQPKQLFFQAMITLMSGKPQKTIALATRALDVSKKNELTIGILKAYMAISSAYSSLGEDKKSHKILKKFRFIAAKGSGRAARAVDVLLLPISKTVPLFKQIKTLPLSTQIALLLKHGYYERAFRLARRKGIMAYVHRFVFFAPTPVIELLMKGKQTALPRAILHLPVFNKEAPVYNLKFLGNLIVLKNQKYLKTKLRPKDTAFLIQLALKAGEPDKSISLDEIYYNFWRNSKNPPRNLSHLLVRIKKALKIPSHLLEVSYKKDNPVLINRGIHFITDYDEYKQTLAQAKALLRAGEWGFAKREFLRAFKLFRGEPFRKMYDDWSDDKRLEILFSYEKEVKTFAEELIKRGRREEAEKLLKKAERIVNS